MHHQPRGGGDDRPRTTHEEDAREERRVLREVLTYYPSSFTLEELIRELTACSVVVAERDAIERAVRDLTAGGLLHSMGDLVLPTRAAVLYYELEA
jgi:crotonobetainyl-CoA:carnitine CoA-transferase CaiB-like acyl-CoA transferase